MSKLEGRTVIQSAAERLRAIVLETEEDALIGSEDVLITQLGCSRSTVRQVARLLEREGLLKVRRGISGGYFSARPDAGTIEATISSYLETLPMDVRDVTVLASALWVVAMRLAAQADPAAAKAMVARLRPRLVSLAAGASFNTVSKLDRDTQAEVFQLANSRYIKLIFDTNVVFSRRRFPLPLDDDGTPEHREFVGRWRDAKLMELNAISSGNAELASMAGQYSREIWHERLSSRFQTTPGNSAPASDSAGAAATEPHSG